MYRIRNFIAFCVILFLCTTCVAEHDKNEFLDMALKTVDNNPQEALQLLEKIPDPELLNQDNYMQYIITYTQARYMSDQDITKDSLILDAQRYFEDQKNYEMAARASFYAANFYREKQQDDKTFEYFLLANYYAQMAKNHLFRAKSMHWLGSIYYNQEELDSAKVYYLQALELYTNEANTELHRLDLTYMLCRTNFELEEFDQALDYSNIGLKMARKLDDKSYEIRFLHNKGIALREKKAYPQAKEYFDLVLENKTNSEDSLLIFLSYARLYRATNQPDSTFYYLNLVKNRMNELSYSYNRVIVYRELLLYYVKEGNEKEANHYLKLKEREETKISNSQIKEIKLVTKKTEKRLQAAEKHLQAAHKHNRLNILYILCAAVVVLLLGWFIFKKQLIKLKDRYSKLRQSNAILNLDINRILVNGLRGIAKSMDVLKQEKKARSQSLPYTSVGEEFQMLRENFNEQIAELTGDMIKQYPNGALALLKICIEDLCILRLTQMKYSDSKIGWMLGYKANIENYVEARKRRMRETMTESGMRTQDINLLFRPIIPV